MFPPCQELGKSHTLRILKILLQHLAMSGLLNKFPALSQTAPIWPLRLKFSPTWPHEYFTVICQDDYQELRHRRPLELEKKSEVCRGMRQMFPAVLVWEHVRFFVDFFVIRRAITIFSPFCNRYFLLPRNVQSCSEIDRNILKRLMIQCTYTRSEAKSILKKTPKLCENYCRFNLNSKLNPSCSLSCPRSDA